MRRKKCLASHSRVICHLHVERPSSSRFSKRSQLGSQLSSCGTRREQCTQPLSLGCRLWRMLLPQQSACRRGCKRSCQGKAYSDFTAAVEGGSNYNPSHVPLKKSEKPNVVVHTFDFRTLEAEAGRSLIARQAWQTE